MKALNLSTDHKNSKDTCWPVSLIESLLLEDLNGLMGVGGEDRMSVVDKSQFMGKSAN